MNNINSELKSFFTAHWEYLTVACACKLNLFDILEQNQMTIKSISEKLCTNYQATIYLITALENSNFLMQQNDIFSLTEKSRYLTENHPESLKYACINWTNEHLVTWNNLEYTIKTGKSAFEKIYHKNYFEFISNSETKLTNYQKAMSEYARDDYKKIAEIIDFSTCKSVMDIGGGLGSVIEYIKLKNPELNCYLFDLEKVIKLNSNKNIIKLAGNFFIDIPKCAEIHLLCRVIHDWDDENTKIILKNSYNALPLNGILYLVENMQSEIKPDLALLSLNMLTICGSEERTKFQYLNLAADAGFKFISELQLNSLQTILKLQKL